MLAWMAAFIGFMVADAAAPPTPAWAAPAQPPASQTKARPFQLKPHAEIGGYICESRAFVALVFPDGSVDFRRGWGLPASYAEAFELLGTHGVVSPDVAASLARMAALRNRLAHGYASVEMSRIWHELPTGFAALETFAGSVASHLGD
jgi:hypothetical protein